MSRIGVVKFSRSSSRDEQHVNPFYLFNAVQSVRMNETSIRWRTIQLAKFIYVPWVVRKINSLLYFRMIADKLIVQETINRGYLI